MIGPAADLGQPFAASGSRPSASRRAIVALLLSAALSAAATADERGWPEDWDEADVARISEGELRFLAPPPGAAVLHADTRLRLDAASLQTGWIEMRQCYRHLDAIDKTAIVYAYREMEALEVTQARNIERYRVESRAVELEGVGQGAQLCLEARVRILRRLSDKTFGLRQGPYHRRFLDGYYPYHLSLAVSYPRDRILLRRIEPAPQPGFELTDTAGGLAIESWFEGELRIELEFVEH